MYPVIKKRGETSTSLQRGAVRLWVMKLYFLQLIRHRKYWARNWVFFSLFYKLWVWQGAVSRSIPPGGRRCTVCGSTAPRCPSWPWAHHGWVEPPKAAAPAGAAPVCSFWTGTLVKWWKVYNSLRLSPFLPVRRPQNPPNYPTGLVAL